MEFHEIANIFPMMTGEDYRALHEDIKDNGLIHSIVLYENKILDGRNRYAACLEVAIEPEYTNYTGDDPLGYVISSNLKRRHLNESQRGMIAARLAKMEQGRPETNRPIGLFISQPEAAEMMNVSTKTVKRSKKVLESKSKELIEAVDRGKKTVSRAATEIKQHEKKDAVKEYSLSVQKMPALEKKYNVIYADPPWQYSKVINTLDATTDHHYHTLSIDELKKYLIENNINTTKDAVLFMWVTNPFIAKSLSVIKAWGFEYKTNIVWVKTNLKKPGVGYYVRGRHELLFICTKGSFTPLDKNISPPIGSVLESSIREHSQKPDEVYNIIERLYSGCTYLELFARNQRDGWDCLGNEVNE